MATSNRSITIDFDGPPDGTQVLEAAENSASPAAVTVQALTSGSNSITVPTSTGVTVTGVTIVPPAGNTTSIKVMDTNGFRLHNTDPSSFSLDSSVTAVTLFTGAAIQAVRFYWS